MKIPKKFLKILKTNQSIHSNVLEIISKLQPILEDNTLYFFEEYTDHGIKHIENVLQAAEFLITDDSFNNINSLEISILIRAVILHDIGMHIEYSTFKELISGTYEKYRVEEMDKKNWKDLWQEYLSEIKRYDLSKKKEIFGEKYTFFSPPKLENKDDLTGYDKN